jgi:hypothetical protein
LTLYCYIRLEELKARSGSPMPSNISTTLEFGRTSQFAHALTRVKQQIPDALDDDSSLLDNDMYNLFEEVYCKWPNI